MDGINWPVTLFGVFGAIVLLIWCIKIMSGLARELFQHNKQQLGDQVEWRNEWDPDNR